jgi:archaellum component FlaG (FlaF/FlaG flagellin family)
MQRLVIFLAALILAACVNEIPPQDQNRINLSILDAGASDVALRVSFDSPCGSDRLVLTRNQVEHFHFYSGSLDTIIEDDSLSPQHTYRYQVSLYSQERLLCSSSEVEVTTLDSTSHIWHSQIDTIGFPFSYLVDVAIVSQAEIWTGGYFYLRDSLGQIESDPYNCAQWDGTRWVARRLLFPTCDEQGNEIDESPGPITHVAAIAPDNIWFSTRASLVQWNGNSFRKVCVPGNLLFGSIVELSGSGPNNIIVAFSDGKVIQYDGSQWSQQQSESSIGLSDFWMDANQRGYAVGSNIGNRGVVMEYDGRTWKTVIESYYLESGFDTAKLFTTQLFGAVLGVWSDPRKKLYVVGDRVYEYAHSKWRFCNSLEENNLEGIPRSWGALNGISGESSNDAIVVGQGSTIRHYNGCTWAQIGTYYNANYDLEWFQVDMKGGMIAAVGRCGEGGVVIRLVR